MHGRQCLDAWCQFQQEKKGATNDLFQRYLSVFIINDLFAGDSNGKEKLDEWSGFGLFRLMIFGNQLMIRNGLSKCG
jgi:hypothetical protein